MYLFTRGNSRYTGMSVSDLSGFRSTGGKILHYHGSSDNSARYSNLVSKTMALSPTDLDHFYRYFRISGMGHCSGGPGQTTLVPEENIPLRLVNWVENGAAPDTIRGAKYVSDTTSLGVSFVRAHCRYPPRNTYNGQGDSAK
jgi:feruloyl esterase